MAAKATKDKQAPKKGLTNDVQLVKMAFPKKKVVIDVVKDLGMSEEYAGVQFVMWDDPSITSLAKVFVSTNKDDESTTQEDADGYFDALTEILIDSNIDGVSFSTREDVIDSFDAIGLPWGFVSQVATLYCLKVVSESNSLKKVFGLSEVVETSGDDSKDPE